MRRIGPLLAALALGPMTIGCGGSTTSGSSSPPSYAFRLQPESGSAVQGGGQVVAQGASFSVRMKLTGLEPNSSDIASIDPGTCRGDDTEPVYVLGYVLADDRGRAVVNQTVPETYRVPRGGWKITVRAGANPSGVGGATIACADLPPRG